jgi:hypothetical protein
LDNDIGLHETINVLAGTAPGLHDVPQAARAAGHTHLGLDDTVVRIDRVRRPAHPKIATGKESLRDLDIHR